jgi:hypothetical protein
MGLLSNIKSDDSIANERDVVGGSRVLESGVYKLTVQHAYVNKASSGAIGIVVSFKTDTKQDLRQTFWITSGAEKGNKNYYTDKNGDKQYLPGYLMANSLCLLTTGQEISELDTEQKVIPLYNAEAKKEVPTTVDMLMDLVGKQVLGAVVKQIVDKTKKNDAGVYVPTGETREENDIDKFFRERDGMTTAEIRGQAEKASFIETWKEKNAGQVRNRVKDGAAKGTAGLPTAGASASKKPTSSLFA